MVNKNNQLTSVVTNINIPCIRRLPTSSSRRVEFRWPPRLSRQEAQSPNNIHLELTDSIRGQRLSSDRARVARSQISAIGLLCELFIIINVSSHHPLVPAHKLILYDCKIAKWSSRENVHREKAMTQKATRAADSSAEIH